MPVARDPPPLPSAQGPITDPQTGLPTPEFYRWLLALMDWAKAVNTAVP